jgi:RecA/RadA recombinase
MAGANEYCDPVAQVAEIISFERGDWFQDPRHCLIWAACCSIQAAGEAIERETVRFALVDWGKLDEAGGDEYLGELARGAVLSASSARMYARKLRDLAERRRLFLLAGQLQDAAIDESRPSEEAAADVQQQLLDLTGQQAGSKAESIEVATVNDILSARPLEWQLSPIIPRGAFVEVHGASGSGKSFVVQDILYCIATRLQWLGRYPLEQGIVVYVCAEGQGGLRQRMRAWMQHHQVCPEQLAGFFVVRQSVDFMHAGEVENLCRAIDAATKGAAPAVVCIDTLSRCLAGNENAAEDMAAFISGIGKVQARYGCAAIVVHHTGHDETRARGSSALKAAADMEFRVEQSGQMITLTCTKAKDAEEPSHIYLRRTIVPLLDGGTSCVIEPHDTARLVLSDFELMVLNFTKEHPEGLRHGQYRSEFVPDTLSNGTLNTVLGRLVQRSLVLRKGEKPNTRYYPGSSSVSDDGEASGSPTLSNPVQLDREV